MNSSRTVKTASTITLLAGAWLFVSPWVYALSSMRGSWDDWIAGIVLVILAAIRIGTPEDTAWMSWFNCLVGAWIFISPWALQYTPDRGMFVNSLCVGLIVFFVAMWSASATPRTHTPLTHGV